MADLTTRLSRFAPFEAAIGFRDRRLRSRWPCTFPEAMDMAFRQQASLVAWC